MSTPKLSTIKLGLPTLAAGLLTGVIIVFIATGPGLASRIQTMGFRPHLPDLGLLATAPLIIQVHIAGALSALLIGIVLLSGVKGTRLHKALGWSWVAAMGLTALSSFGIRQINHGHLSLIHTLSGWTVIALPMAVWAIRRGKIKGHAQAMTGLFVGGLVIAGALSFLPGRLMWRIVFG